MISSRQKFFVARYSFSFCKEPGFEHAVRYVLRDINYEQLCQELLTIDKKKVQSLVNKATEADEKVNEIKASRPEDVDGSMGCSHAWGFTWPRAIRTDGWTRSP